MYIFIGGFILCITVLYMPNTLNAKEKLKGISRENTV